MISPSSIFPASLCILSLVLDISFLNSSSERFIEASVNTSDLFLPPFAGLFGSLVFSGFSFFLAVLDFACFSSSFCLTASSASIALWSMCAAASLSFSTAPSILSLLSVRSSAFEYLSVLPVFLISSSLSSGSLTL